MELFRTGNLGLCYFELKWLSDIITKWGAFRSWTILSQTFLRTSSSSSVRMLPASLSSGLVRGEGSLPSGLWLPRSRDFWPLTMPWEWPEDTDRWGLLHTTPARGQIKKKLVILIEMETQQEIRYISYHLHSLKVSDEWSLGHCENSYEVKATVNYRKAATVVKKNDIKDYLPKYKLLSFSSSSFCNKRIYTP